MITGILCLIFNKNFNLNEQLNNFLMTFADTFERGLVNRKMIETEYFSKLLGTDEYLTYKSKNGVFRARISGIDEYGRIILCDKKGEKRIFGFKEVELLNN